MPDRFLSAIKRLCASAVFAALLAFPLAPIMAAIAQPASDSLSSLSTSAFANHTIVFKTPSGVTSPGETVAVALPDFIFGSVAISDVNLSEGPSTGLENPQTLAPSAAAGVWGVVISGTTITFTAPTDAGPTTVPPNDLMAILIGTNAVGGVHQLQNPSTPTSAQIFINGSFGDANTLGVPILNNNSVSVTAVVPPPVSVTPGGGGGGGGPSAQNPPVISNIQAINITTTGATITWQTDVAANSKVDFGFTTSYASGTVTDGSSVTLHSLTITGLTPGTVYHFKVTSMSPATLLSSSSADQTFQTASQTAPPVISNVLVVAITDTSALVTWDTDVPASSLVNVGTTPSYGVVATTPGSVTNHAVQLLGLTPSTLYHFQVESTNAQGNTADSADGQFVTAPDTTPPANVTSLTATPGDSQVALSWTNPPDPDFAGTRIVRKLGGYPTNPFDGTLVFDGAGNNTVDTGLVNGTTYYYAAYAYDASGNFASGALASATPTGPIIPPPTTTSTPPTTTSTPPTATTTPPVVPPVTPPVTPPVVPPPSGASVTTTNPGVNGALPVTFFTSGGALQLTPDANGTVGVLPSASVTAVVSSLVFNGNVPKTVSIVVGGSLYNMNLSADGTRYSATFVAPPSGLASMVVTAAFANGTTLESGYRLQVEPAGVVTEANPLGYGPAVPNASVTLYEQINGTWTPVATTQTHADGSYAFAVPNGTYYAEVSKDGYNLDDTSPMTVDHNVFGSSAQLIRIPTVIPTLNLQQPIAPQLLAITSASIARLAYGLNLLHALTQSAPVQTVARVGAPSIIAITLLATTGGFSLFNLLAFLQLLTTEPILIFNRRKRSTWGMVYNSLGKVPIDLAIVRLVQAQTKLVVQSRVTDRDGRYFFNAKPGSYLIEAVKPGYVFPSVFLKGETVDDKLIDLYTGGAIAVAADRVLAYNIPVDPQNTELSDKQIRRSKLFRQIREFVAIAGVFGSSIVVLIQPSLVNAIILLCQVGLYLLFKRLVTAPPAQSWGSITDSVTHKPISQAVVRVFERKFNKLLETQITDRFGRYGFLVKDNTYYVTIDKPGYEHVQSEDIDLTKTTGNLINKKIVLKPIKK